MLPSFPRDTGPGGVATWGPIRRLLRQAAKLSLAILAAVGPLAGLAVAAPASVAPAKAVHPQEPKILVVFVLDRSSSMSEDERIKHLIEATRLGVFLLDGDLQIVAFSDAATSSPIFNLKTQRNDAVQFIESLTPLGRTSYLAALKAQDGQPAAVARVFVSDGQPQDPEEAILDHLRAAPRCPLHTIAMTTPPEAEQLLARMAAVTGGGFYRVRQPAGVVEAFLRVLQAVRGLRRYDMTDRALRLDDVQGEILLIGCDAEPRVSSSERVDRQVLPLAGSQIYVVRATMPQKKSVTVTKAPVPAGSSPGPVIVLRFDLLTSRTDLQCVGSSQSERALLASSTFYDAAGRQVDPRGNAKLTARFELVDAQGDVVASTAGQAASDRPALEALFHVPRGQSRFYEVICRTTDSSCGTPFAATEKRVVDVAAMPVVPKVKAATVVNALAGRRGEEMRLRIDIEAIGPLEVARRTFLEEAVKTPPAVVVHSPDRRAVDSRLRPEAFVVRAATHDSTRATFEIGFLATESAGEYHVQVQEGTAGGVTYPAAIAAARCVDDDELQLIIVEDTTAGPRVLYDSAQGWCRRALAGNGISLKLVRGTMDPRMFAGLAGGLVARLIGKDGAVEEVKLTFHGDRYVTEAVPMPNPGILKVEVDIALDGLRLRYEGQIDIQRLTPRLSVLRQPICTHSAYLPCGAIASFEAGVVGETNGEPAAFDRLLDFVRRDCVVLRCVLRDAARRQLYVEDHAPSQNPWATTVWLRQSGQQELTIELRDGRDNLLDAVGWTFEVVQSPFEVTLAVREGDQWQPADDSGNGWARILPSWLVTSPPCYAIVRSMPSPLSAKYYLSGVAVDGQEVRFDPANAWYAYPLTQSGPIPCIGRLRSYENTSSGWGGAEIQVKQEPHFVLPVEVRGVALAVRMPVLSGRGFRGGWARMSGPGGGLPYAPAAPQAQPLVALGG